MSTWRAISPTEVSLPSRAQLEFEKGALVPDTPPAAGPQDPPALAQLQLKFADGELEREFLHSYRTTARPWVRMSLLVALSTVLGFAVIDHWLLVGPRLVRPDVWRFGLQLPLVLITLVLTDPRLYLRWYQPAVQVAAPLFGVGTVLMAIEATPAQVPLVAARLVLAAFYFYFMLGFTFRAAVRANLLLMAAYTVAALIGAVAPTVAIYSLFVLLCANVIGGAGCYALEYANRVAFIEHRRLAQVASHDGLTGVLNRAALEEQVVQLWRHAAAERMPVSLLLIDIDHFKAYNDRYGHQAGDRCLQQVATAIQAAARRRGLDLVARYGGEEFIVVFAGADRSEAVSTAAALKHAVTELAIVHDASTTQPHVTVSIGVTTLEPGDVYSHEHAVRQADLALYRAKERGRDGWAFHGELDTGAAPAAERRGAAAPALTPGRQSLA
jgi:diguanylate cyclase (GGDEF)-like protein